MDMALHFTRKPTSCHIRYRAPYIDSMHITFKDVLLSLEKFPT